MNQNMSRLKREIEFKMRVEYGLLLAPHGTVISMVEINRITKYFKDCIKYFNFPFSNECKVYLSFDFPRKHP